ncbi:MAG: SDR family oxidoreductase [Acidimicrobiia bacterium]|nr:SDR family oxidoreductase [Acidimicrobiia bacterium]
MYGRRSQRNGVDVKALITGGSQGLGRALAEELAARDWQVIITGRHPETLHAVAAANSAIAAVVGSVRSESHRSELAASVGDSLDLLVNNASYLGPSPLSTLVDFGEDELHAVFDTNVVSPISLIGHVAPALQTAGGVVVNVSSDAAVEAYENWGPYAASKAALDHASAILAVEQPQLRVYAVDPGDMRTAMHQAAFPHEDISDRPLPETVVPSLLRLIESGLPSGRYVASQLGAHAA